MIGNSQRLRAFFKPISQAMYNFEPKVVRNTLEYAFAPDATIHLCHPIGDLCGPAALYEQAYEPLLAAIPDLERRDTLIMAGNSRSGDNWIGCLGYFTGTFRLPWLDIPPTGHFCSIRYHEFYRVVDEQIVEMQAIWDIPELMMQANAWPMAPSLGREWLVPGPATEDGLTLGTDSEALTRKSEQVVFDMCSSLGKFADEGLEGMRLNDYWHPRCSWYGPAGIGSCRRLEGFRNWHQIPFLRGMPNRVGDPEKGFMFADNNYVGFTAWPGMHMTISDDGWLGIPPVNKKISMCSLDFWRVESGLIRENWVLIDVLDTYRQVGVDVLARMREFNKARGLAPMEP